MRQHHADRLATLHYFIQKDVPAKHFDLEMLAMSPKGIKGMFALEPECGTVGCVAGWCPVVFPEDWKYEIDCVVPNGLVPVLKKLESKTPLHNWDDWEVSFEQFFGLTNQEVVGLCYESSYPKLHPTKADVLKKMRKLADKHGYSI